MRQQGRERAANVIDVEAQADAITAAIGLARSAEFRESIDGVVNPYGDGTAAEKIVEVLAKAPLGPELLIKKAQY